MSDIVERLKELTTGGHVYYKAAERIEEAAAEITRLREALAEAGKVIEPFAEAEEYIGEPERLPDNSSCVYLGAIGLNVGHIRAARRWMDGRTNQ